MAWTEQKHNRYRGLYRDAANKKRVAGSSTSKRAALKLAQDEEAKIRQGSWQDPGAGRITFADYFENHWLPSGL